VRKIWEHIGCDDICAHDAMLQGQKKGCAIFLEYDASSFFIKKSNICCGSIAKYEQYASARQKNNVHEWARPDSLAL
jgi:hypothetical protein